MDRFQRECLHGNGVPNVSSTVGTARQASFISELYKKHPICTRVRLFERQIEKHFADGARVAPSPPPIASRAFDTLMTV